MSAPDIVLSQSDLAALVELAPELAEDTSLTSLLGRLLDKAVALTASTAGTVYLYDEQRRKLYVAHAVGPTASVVIAKFGAAGEGIPIVGSKAGGVFTSGTPIVVNEIAQDPEHFTAVDKATARPTKSMIAVPLVVAGERIGVVQLLDRTSGPYTSYEETLLAKFASLAAVAVRNARLFSDLAARIGAYGLPRDSVDAATLRSLLNAPAKEERLSVLFADMRGYSRLDQMLRHPEQLQIKLNEFLSMLATAVREQGGVVNKFLGDGLMALFRGPNHETRAVRCAHNMVERFAPMRERWDDDVNESLSFVEVGVGIATDTVTLGTVGSDEVREFTAVGRAVNLASTLVYNARDGHRVLTDRQTVRNAAAVIEESRVAFAVQIKSVGPDGPNYEVHEILRLRAGDEQETVKVPMPPPMVMAPSSRQVFVSYSHADTPYLDELHTHLRPYLKREDFELWDDTASLPATAGAARSKPRSPGAGAADCW